MGAAMDLRARRREAQRQLLEEVYRTRDNLRGQFAEQSRRMAEQWEAQGRRVTEQWETQRRRLNDELEKLYQYTDRFL